MEQRRLVEQIRVLIASGETAGAFSLLKQIQLKGRQRNNLSLLEGEFLELHQKELKNLMSYDEIQIARNKINDRLIRIVADNENKWPRALTKGNVLLILMVIGVLITGLVYSWSLNQTSLLCPDFSSSSKNKVLILPFENVGSEPARPQLILRDRINQLAGNAALSTEAMLGTSNNNMSMKDAPSLATSCQADLLIWGTYSAKSDSTRIILQYYFKDAPEKGNPGELITIKDITALQHGRMLKGLDDAIYSLCALIAFRDNQRVLAKKWINKIKQPEAIDQQVLEIIE